ncbi:coiled-coil domain-containing protein 42 homolog [Neolamprologus brichardi]|uniref:coiled-coil domain-containing protein 42 homolog n=1 Tax=Neolamprologus brichardi TaxID=32507 RepID=UPI0003EC3250|nr:coiled-coil domain-containing protein 42 homolog [Neolamprologus brichardi]
MFSQLTPEESASRMWTAAGRDSSYVLVELQVLQREQEELKAKYEESKQVLESLQQREEELHKKIKEIQDLHLSFDMYHKDEEANRAIEKAEQERQRVLQKEAEIERLKEQFAKLTEEKQELEHQLKRHSVYRDLMEQLLKITKFKDVAALTDHLESLLHFRCQLSERESKAQEQADEQRKALLTLEQQHNLLLLQRNNQLSQLQTKLEKTHSEGLIWEKKWNNIQETAARKTLKLGQIKMSILNLYEMTGGQGGGEEGVDVNDTEKQLEQVKQFFEDQTDIVQQYQPHSQRRNNDQGRQKSKKPTNKEM